MNDLPWFWEIQRSGSGPHYYLILEFAANEAELKQWIEPLLSVDYEFDDSLRIWVHKSSGACCYTQGYFILKMRLSVSKPYLHRRSV